MTRRPSCGLHIAQTASLSGVGANSSPYCEDAAISYTAPSGRSAPQNRALTRLTGLLRSREADFFNFSRSPNDATTPRWCLFVGLPSRLQGENADGDHGGRGALQLHPERRVQRHHDGAPAPEAKAQASSACPVLPQFSLQRIPMFSFWRRLPPALHDHVHDIHKHGLVVLVQGGGSELDQALRRTRLRRSHLDYLALGRPARDCWPQSARNRRPGAAAAWWALR
jgi:hypothetical protein